MAQYFCHIFNTVDDVNKYISLTDSDRIKLCYFYHVKEHFTSQYSDKLAYEHQLRCLCGVYEIFSDLMIKNMKTLLLCHNTEDYYIDKVEKLVCSKLNENFTCNIKLMKMKIRIISNECKNLKLF